jgi:hypothetical protein
MPLFNSSRAYVAALLCCVMPFCCRAEVVGTSFGDVLTMPAGGNGFRTRTAEFANNGPLPLTAIATRFFLNQGAPVTSTQLAPAGLTRISDTCTGALAVGNSCNVVIRFKPLVGFATSAVRLDIDLGGAGGSVAFLAETTEPQIVADVNPVNVDAIPGGIAAERVVVYTMQAGSVTNLSASIPLSASPTYWALVGNTCPIGAGVLVEGSTCTLQVRFQPPIGIEAGSTGSNPQPGSLYPNDLFWHWQQGNTPLDAPRQPTRLNGRALLPVLTPNPSATVVQAPAGGSAEFTVNYAMADGGLPSLDSMFFSAGPFSIVSNSCLRSTVFVQGSACAITYRFTPTSQIQGDESLGNSAIFVGANVSAQFGRATFLGRVNGVDRLLKDGFE